MLYSDNKDNVAIAFIDNDLNTDVDDELMEVINKRIKASKMKRKRKDGYDLDSMPKSMRSIKEEYKPMIG